jgi:hypothetical protein
MFLAKPQIVQKETPKKHANKTWMEEPTLPAQTHSRHQTTPCQVQALELELELALELELELELEDLCLLLQLQRTKSTCFGLHTFMMVHQGSSPAAQASSIPFPSQKKLMQHSSPIRCLKTGPALL